MDINTVIDSLTPNTSILNSLDSNSEIDLFSIDLKAGSVYGFDLSSLSTLDPTLALYDAKGNRLEFNDDKSVDDSNSHIDFTASVAGTYYVEVQSWNNSSSGDYELNIVGTEPENHSPELTGSVASLANAQQKQPYNISIASLLQGYTDSDNDALSVTNLKASTGGLIDNGNGVWSITPTTTGVVTLNYSVTDGVDVIRAQTSFSVIAAPLTPTISVTPIADTHTTEAGGVVKYAVSLNVQPSANGSLNILFTSNKTTEGGFAANSDISATKTLSFTSTNWSTPQILTVTGVQDYSSDGNQDYLVNAVASQGAIPAPNYLSAIRSFNTQSPLSLTNDADIAATGADRDIPVYLVGDDGRPQEDVLNGNDGADRLYGGYMVDELHGGIGDDRQYGGYEDDFLYGDSGNDKLYGEQDDDYIVGGDGNDRMDGGIGVDTLNGGQGSDIYYVTLGDDGLVEDIITENPQDTGVDTIYVPFAVESYVAPVGIEVLKMNAGFGASELTGNASNNQLYGNAGDNSVFGGDGNDNVIGGSGNDLVSGGNGDDVLMGDKGNDQLRGGVGADILLGGVGNDVIRSGTERDIFQFNTFGVDNADTLPDFNVSDDTIQLQVSVFTAIGSTFTSSEFWIGASAHDSNDRVIYNTTTGALSYDTNGNAAGGVQLIATLQTGLKLTVADFSMFA